MSMNGEVISVRIKPTESTTVAKLGVTDQIKLLLSKFSNDDAAELNAAEKVSAQALKMKASLIRLFETATKGLADGSRHSVTLQVSSVYLPYLDEVINEKTGMGLYYKFTVYTKDLPLNVVYNFVVKIEKKVS